MTRRPQRSGGTSPQKKENARTAVEWSASTPSRSDTARIPAIHFRRTETCAECPWLKDTPVSRFPPERYQQLRSTCEQGFNNLFACHKTAEGHETVCVGYLLVDGLNNFRVRLAVIQGQYDPRKLKASGPLYASYREMAAANGYVPGRTAADE